MGAMRQLSMSVGYFFIATFVFGVLWPGQGTTATPAPAMWAFVLVAAVINVGFMGAFIVRWRAVEDDVPRQIKARAPQKRRA